MSDDQTGISSVTKVQSVRVLADGIYAFAEELQDIAIEKERRSKVRKLAAHFLIFVDDSMDDMLHAFEDELDFLESCMEVFIENEDVMNDEPASQVETDEDSPAFGKEEVLKVAEQFKDFLSKAMDTESLSGSEDAHDYVEGSMLRFLESKNKLR